MVRLKSVTLMLKSEQKKTGHVQKLVTNKKSTIFIQSPPNLAKKTTPLLIILAKFCGGLIKIVDFLLLTNFYAAVLPRQAASWNSLGEVSQSDRVRTQLSKNLVCRIFTRLWVSRCWFSRPGVPRPRVPRPGVPRPEVPSTRPGLQKFYFVNDSKGRVFRLRPSL